MQPAAQALGKARRQRPRRHQRSASGLGRACDEMMIRLVGTAEAGAQLVRLDAAESPNAA